MSNLGIASFSSVYASNAASVYGLSQVKDKQDSFAMQTSFGYGSDEINDEAIVSDAALALLEKDKKETQELPIDKTAKAADGSEAKNDVSKAQNELTPEQKDEVAKLKLRDAEVKTHEQAHISAAAGINASAPTFTYQTGPDGQKYAVGGEVSISFVQSQNPEENIANAETMRAAAMAPAEPSGQDLSVARAADKIIADAKQKIAEQKEEQASEVDKTSKSFESKGSEKLKNDEKAA